MLAVLTLLCAVLICVSGHGYMQDPAARNAMWKFGFRGAPTNYNLNEQFCGGVGGQYKRNGGKCGICGDPYDRARRHEVGGSMYDGRIVKTYSAEQTIDVKIKLTANHKGNFVFKICPTEAKPTKEVTQECLDQNVLEVANTRGTDPKKFVVHQKDGTATPLLVKLKLPAGMTCERCVLQWTYTAGNNWGCDKPGDWRACGLGKGDQETFVNCADVTIE